MITSLIYEDNILTFNFELESTDTAIFKEDWKLKTPRCCFHMPQDWDFKSVHNV